MANRDLLIEIGLEEMPARFVTSSMNQLADKVRKWATEHQLSFEQVLPYSTPRRLAIVVKSLSEKQSDVTIEAKGPAKKIAQDENGNWSKAAQGFVRGQGVSVDDIFFKEINGIEYVHVQKHVKGKETSELLKEITEVITSLHFPKNMRWANEDLRYVRPIKWLTVLFGEEIVPVEISNVKADRFTYGHRFLGEKVTIASPEKYVETLLGQFVIVEPTERKEAIQSQLAILGDENGWSIPVDADLLEEVNNLVEYPTALFGNFEEEYLSLPEEVLITSMKEHQRYFPVKSKEGQLLPHFVTVRNGNHEHLDVVARGNEKVLRARLSDAAFFYKEDEKLVIDEAVAKLDKIVFHEEIGTTGTKVKRVRAFAEHIAKQLKMDDDTLQHVLRAGAIYKFDLVSQMVYEFPELQGIMGEKYAKAKGEADVVAIAINEHYMPRSADDNTPSSDIGALLSIADKLDTIASFFAIGVIPTGSQDPYALRRQASGVVHTLLNKGWSTLSLQSLLQYLIEEYEKVEILKRDKEEVLQELLSFFGLRVKNLLQEDSVRYDIIDAVLSLPLTDVSAIVSKAKVLEEKKHISNFKGIVESLSRVLNIAKKAEGEREISPSLFKQSEEEALYSAYKELQERIHVTIEEQRYSDAFDMLAKLQQPIDDYFDNIMVMTDEEEVKVNRLAQMDKLASLIARFGDWNKILVK